MGLACRSCLDIRNEFRRLLHRQPVSATVLVLAGALLASSLFVRPSSGRRSFTWRTDDRAGLGQRLSGRRGDPASRRLGGRRVNSISSLKLVFPRMAWYFNEFISLTFCMASTVYSRHHLAIILVYQLLFTLFSYSLGPVTPSRTYFFLTSE